MFEVRLPSFLNKYGVDADCFLPQVLLLENVSVTRARIGTEEYTTMTIMMIRYLSSLIFQRLYYYSLSLSLCYWRELIHILHSLAFRNYIDFALDLGFFHIYFFCSCLCISLTMN